MEESSPPPVPPSLPFWTDGEFHHVSPDSVPVGRIGMAITSCIVIGLSFFAMLFISLNPDLSRFVKVAALVTWISLFPVLGVYSWVWPGVSYRHTFFCLKEDCIIIRSGVFWKTETVVPKSRIQHTDISQGPLQRGYEISDLIIHTAGTRFAVVTLGGLSQKAAPRLRDHLLDRTDDDSTL